MGWECIGEIIKRDYFYLLNKYLSTEYKGFSYFKIVYTIPLLHAVLHRSFR